MSEPVRPTDVEAPEIAPQDRFIAPDQPEDPAARLDQVEPDEALDEQPSEGSGQATSTDRDEVDEEVAESFPASDPPATP
jgi:hypothetical protein